MRQKTLAGHVLFGLRRGGGYLLYFQSFIEAENSGGIKSCSCVIPTERGAGGICYVFILGLGGESGVSSNVPFSVLIILSIG